MSHTWLYRKTNVSKTQLTQFDVSLIRQQNIGTLYRNRTTTAKPVTILLYSHITSVFQYLIKIKPYLIIHETFQRCSTSSPK